VLTEGFFRNIKKLVKESFLAYLGIENPRVGGSIPPPATNNFSQIAKILNNLPASAAAVFSRREITRAPTTKYTG